MKFEQSIINLPYGRNVKYFRKLFEAIIRVNKKYIRYSTNNTSKKNVFEEQEHVERVFAYELYRQWANLLEETNTCNITLNGEIAKMLKSVDIQYTCDLTSSPKKRKTIFPDMVLHSSQSNNKKQKMICEIKRKNSLTPQNLFADLLKLCCYMDAKSYDKSKEDSAFEYGVFILVDGNLDTIKDKVNINPVLWYNGKKKEWISFSKSKKYTVMFENIVCITYNGKDLMYDTLDHCLK